MAAKTLDEAIKTGLTTVPISPHGSDGMQSLLDHFKKELRDYFAHEVMRFNNTFSKSGYSPEQIELASSAVADFFYHIFKDVPAFGGVKVSKKK